MENKPKIMIVDDAEMNRQLLMSILGEEYTYIEAEDGNQALHLLQKDLSIDLMLLDINMPKMDGFQVLERMNRFHWISEIPVIMISSEEKKDVIERAYQIWQSTTSIGAMHRMGVETSLQCRRYRTGPQGF